MKIEDLTKNLSESEKKVFFYAISNMSIDEIANELEMTNHAIRFHLANIYKKTETKGRIDLATKCIQPNLLLMFFELSNEFERLKEVVKNYLPIGNNQKLNNNENRYK